MGLNLEELAYNIQNQIFEMAHQLHFNEVDAEDVQDANVNPLTSEDLLELTEENLPILTKTIVLLPMSQV